MNLPLFCFGSLMDSDVLACVLDKPIPERLHTEPASFHGYRKARLPHESYPLLVPEAGSVVEGIIISGLDKSELDRIVFFEGEEYELTPCEVNTDRGVVGALFFDEGIMPPARTEQWDFVEWRRDHKPLLLRQTKVYMSYYGSMSAVEADKFWQNYRDPEPLSGQQQNNE